jgi:hypothetical protein
MVPIPKGRIVVNLQTETHSNSAKPGNTAARVKPSYWFACSLSQELKSQLNLTLGGIAPETELISAPNLQSIVIRELRLESFCRSQGTEDILKHDT